MDSGTAFVDENEFWRSGGEQFSVSSKFGPLAPDSSVFSIGTIHLSANERENQFSIGPEESGAIEQVSIYRESSGQNFLSRLYEGDECRKSQLHVTDEKLYQLPSKTCSSSPGRLDYESEGNQVLNGLAAMQAKIRSFESSHIKSSTQVAQLQRATDVYTHLLNKNTSESGWRRSSRQKNKANRSVQTGITAPRSLDLKKTIDIDKDLEIRSAELLRRLSYGSRKHPSPHFPPLGDESDVEKVRYGSGGARSSGRPKVQGSPPLPPESNPRGELSLEGSGRHGQRSSATLAPSAPAMDFSLDASVEAMRPVSVDLSSTGSSVRLNEKQRNKLSSYREKLLREINDGNQDRPGSAGETERRIPAESDHPDQQGEKFGVNDELSSKEAAEKSEEIDFCALRERLARLKDDVIQRRKDLPVRSQQKQDRKQEVETMETDALDPHVQEKRSRSEPASPSRKALKKEPAFSWEEQLKDAPTDFKPPPFVAAKSTSASFSVNVNLQQLLAVLKTQNPALHSLCLRLGPTTPTRQLAKAFRYELARSIQKAEEELEKQIKLYDDVCEKLNLSVTEKERKKLELERGSLTARLEQKDLTVQRLQQQYAKLHSLLFMEESGENAAHKCKLNSVRIGTRVLPRTGRTHIRDHTVSSFSKATVCNRKSPVKAAHVGSSWLRDLRQLQSVLEEKTYAQ